MLGKNITNVRIWQKFAQKYIAFRLFKYTLLSLLYFVLLSYTNFVLKKIVFLTSTST
jgi:hypothetical protein